MSSNQLGIYLLQHTFKTEKRKWSHLSAEKHLQHYFIGRKTHLVLFNITLTSIIQSISEEL